MDQVFRALADPTRRRLLDLLFERDGRTLTELEQRPSMTRFGVMKHLRLLEEAGLITTRRSGRHKLHYLNPVPIRLIHDRWVSKYAEPWAAGLSGLKQRLEDETMSERPSHVYEVFIRTTPERLWAALTEGEMTKDYYYGSRVESDWGEGSGYTYFGPDGSVQIEGRVVASEPPRRLVTTFSGRWEEAMAEDPPSRVTYLIEPVGGVCKLTLIHEDLVAGSATEAQTAGGWPFILSALKTLLETGEPLPMG